MARYSDINTVADSAADFIIRKRTPTIQQVIMIFLATFIVAISIMLTTVDRVALTIILIIMLTAAGTYVVVQLQRNRDLVLTTEFQNALFASALGINNKFCLIIRKNGNIVYLDRSFQDLFPDFARQPYRTIDMLLNYGKLSQEERKKIFEAVDRNVYDKVIFNLRDAKGDFHKIIMSIEPIVRPSGFIFLRGREYVDSRGVAGAGDPASSPLSKSTVTLFSYIMDSMDMGVYMTNPSGSMIYANPVLEQWLGFKEGEIAAGSLSLQDIIRYSGDRSSAIQPENYEGVVALLKKSGGTMQGFINQKTIRNNEGKIIGCTALVHNIVEQAVTEKKKLW